MDAVGEIYQQILSRKAEEMGIEEVALRSTRGEEVVTLAELAEEMDREVSRLIEGEFVHLDGKRFELREGQLRNYDLQRKRLHHAAGEGAIVAALALGSAYAALHEPDTLWQLSANEALATESKRKLGKTKAGYKAIRKRALISVLCEAIWQGEEKRQLSTGTVAREVFEIIKAARHEQPLDSPLPTSHRLLEETVSKYGKDDLRSMMPTNAEALRKTMKGWQAAGHLNVPGYAEKSGPRS